MSKVLKVVATVVGVALVVASMAIPGLNVVVAGAMLAMGATLALGGISSLMAPKPKAAAGGPPEKWKADQFAGIPYAMGRTAVGGNIVLKAGHGANNVFLTTLTALSLGPIASIDTTYFDKVATTFSGGSATGTFAGHVYQATQLGACPEAASITPPTSAPPGWSSTAKLSGIAAAMTTFKYDSTSKTTFTTIPQPLWLLHGVKVYDPRLDSTYPGGSGSCRPLVESTYVYSENPGLHALTWCLGQWQNGVRVAGIGAPMASLDVPSFIECANLCDARTWILGGQVYTRPDTLWNSLTAMLQAGGSSPVFYGGKISTINAAPRVSLATVTGDDIIGDCTFSATQARRDRINQVIPNYRSEDHDWSVIPGSAVIVPSFVTMDGDERTKEVNYPLVQNVHQASQLACYEIYNSREAGPGTINLKPFYLNYRPGDCVTFAPESGASIKVEITGRELDPSTGMVTLDVRGETDAKHAFALAQTGTAPPIVSIAYDNSVAAPGASDWSLAGTTLSANNTASPALVVTGALSNPNADAVIFEYRLHNVANGTDDNWIGAGTETPTTIRKEIVSVTPSTSYDVSVRYRVRGVLSDRRIIGPATSGNGVIDWSAVGNAAGTRPANNATKNTPTYSTTAPTSPVPTDGDIWADTSAVATGGPIVFKMRIAGAWQVVANNVSGTSQITDTANLGKTAFGLDPTTGTVLFRVPSNLVGIGSPGNLFLDPNFADQSLFQVIGTNCTFYTATQAITPAGVATADTSAATDLATMGAIKAVKHLGGGGSGRWISPYYQLPAPGTYTASVRFLFKSGFTGTGGIAFVFYDKNKTFLLSSPTTPINYTALAADTLQDVTATAVAPAGAFYVNLQANVSGTTSNWYTALPTIRPVSTAGTVSLGDTSNMVPDPDFADAAITWAMPTAWTVSPNTTAGSGASVNKITASTAGAGGQAVTANIPCAANKSLVLSFFAKRTAGSDSSYFLIGAYFYNSAKTFLSQVYTILNTSVADGRTQAIYKSPANTAYVRYFIYTAGAGANAWEISEPILRFASVSGDNLIAGNGTTVLNDTAIVTNVGYSAGFFGQGYFATGTDFSFMTGTKKPADNATVGAIAGTNLKDSGGTVVNDNGFLNQHVTVDPTTGQLINIGTTGVVVDNSKQTMDTLTDGTTFKKISGSWVSGGKAVINFADTIHTNKNLATIDGAANTKLSGIATGATMGATWGTNVTGQPTNLSGINATEGSKLGGVQTGADVTATNQVSVTYTSGKTISADSTGTIASGVLPSTIPAPRVTLGGVDVTQSNNVSYAIVTGSDTGGCTGNISVDNTTGSTSKGLQTIGSGFNASGGYQLQITVNGYALPVIGVTVTKKLADPPAGGGGGGGTGVTSGTMSAGGYAVYSGGGFTQVGSIISNLAVATGKTATCSGGDDYSVLAGTGHVQSVIVQVKWQYAATGSGSWTDVSTASTGSQATYNNLTGDDYPGSVSSGPTVSPSAGAYDFRLVAKVSSGTTGAGAQFAGTGSWGVNIA